MVQLDNNKLSTTIIPACNASILSETTKKDLAYVVSPCLLSLLVLSTLLVAIDVSCLVVFPGLIAKLGFP